MVDLKSQYTRYKDEIDKAIFSSIGDFKFINGPDLEYFSKELSKYQDNAHVIPCANGTDALMIALMALELQSGDEVIVPSFTYVASAEVIALLGLTPVLVDVDPFEFNITIANIKNALSPKTRAIIPVHLYGQCVDMEPILSLASDLGIYVIEDAAQAIGSKYIFKNGITSKSGSMGTIGCTSFFPSKNLGCFGDGGAIFTKDIDLARKMRMISNHGQPEKYFHKYVGVNSRLDTLQAAVLRIKLKYLDEFNKRRTEAADRYDELLLGCSGVITPKRSKNSTHVFHQYTLLVDQHHRSNLKNFLQKRGVPSMIYYPLPLNEQEAFKSISRVSGELKETQRLCKTVLSLPMHTELTTKMQLFIVETINEYFKK